MSSCPVCSSRCSHTSKVHRQLERKLEKVLSRPDIACLPFHWRILRAAEELVVELTRAGKRYRWSAEHSMPAGVLHRASERAECCRLGLSLLDGCGSLGTASVAVMGRYSTAPFQRPARLRDLFLFCEHVAESGTIRVKDTVTTAYVSVLID